MHPHNQNPVQPSENKKTTPPERSYQTEENRHRFGFASDAVYRGLGKFGRIFAFCGKSSVKTSADKWKITPIGEIRCSAVAKTAVNGKFSQSETIVELAEKHRWKNSSFWPKNTWTHRKQRREWAVERANSNRAVAFLYTLFTHTLSVLHSPVRACGERTMCLRADFLALTIRSFLIGCCCVYCSHLHPSLGRVEAAASLGITAERK